jgi:predicted nucleic acid-binding protein
MRFLLDTNVLSETAKPRPDRPYARWARAQHPGDIVVSAMTFGEVQSGIELLPHGQRRDALENWLRTLIQQDFRGRILRVNTDIALAWGRLVAAGQQRGRVLPPIDGILLATALVYDLVLVTRNERDFADRGVAIVNPWSSDSNTTGE